MIVDAHCHLWRRWPYATPAPADGATTRALLDTMAASGVARAAIVAAGIGGGDPRTANPDNNDDVAGVVGEHPGALRMFADVDSRWSRTYHRPGAAGRLEHEVTRLGARGFTHYLADADDGWFETAEADAFFSAAERLGLVASLHAPPPWHRAVAGVAQRHPGLTVLLHHQGLARSDDELEALLALAAHPGIGVKVSGFRYVSAEEAPYADVRTRLERLARAFGPERLAWGSDWPVSTANHSYADALGFAADALGFLDPSERARVFGGTALSLLRWEP